MMEGGEFNGNIGSGGTKCISEISNRHIQSGCWRSLCRVRKKSKICPEKVWKKSQQMEGWVFSSVKEGNIGKKMSLCISSKQQSFQHMLLFSFFILTGHLSLVRGGVLSHVCYSQVWWILRLLFWPSMELFLIPPPMPFPSGLHQIGLLRRA